MPARSTISVWERVNRDAIEDEHGCWVWQRSHTAAGYGLACLDGKVLYARRWLYVEMGGEIPEGMQLAHLCGNRACVCPFHMEPMTRKQIAQRAFGSPEGARKRYPNGYVSIKRNGKWVYEHRAVVEDALGRKLAAEELVHHINGVLDDNRPENLQLMRHGQPKGQAFRCAECGSHNVVPTEVASADH